MQQDRQAREIGKPDPGTYLHRAKWQHAWRQRRNSEPGHDGRSDRGYAPSDKNLGPGYACRIEKLPSHHADAAGFGKRGDRQRLVRAMLPTRRSEPAHSFFGEDFPVASPNMKADDHRVEFPSVKTLKQIARGSDSNLDQQLWVLCVHASDQRGKFRSRNMVADADGEALAGSGKCGERAIVNLQEFAGVREKGCALGGKLHVPWRAFNESTTESVFQPLQLQTHTGLRRLKRLGRTCEAAKLRDANERLNDIHVKGAPGHIKSLSLI